ncbi:SHOCT domain-containing protein [Lysinibacillus xylanilyticus]|uniref:SHOCT domain-containing protein n=1 Tax=Lysinibacillus xylanilyticus TaxID=582475 RepID=UPI002B24973B|nr:SHOCT domain-containing protein [Lysinibacillus xylanilyticus]MEB2281083.1 SHOCT domain-containing protein [Lysinibacillus xylanilyticus]
MGFFSLKEVCGVCEQEVGLNRFRIAEKKWVCNSCFKDANLKKIGANEKSITKMTVEDIKNAIIAQKVNKIELDNFNPTKSIGSFIEFDDVNKKFLILSAILRKRNKATVYNYSDIVDFELLEDGESVSSGGLGRALVGGALFGGTGAIVGGVTGPKKSKSICSSLKLKITLNNINNPAVYVTFIESDFKKSGMIYKTVYKQAQECLSVLQLICNQQQPTVAATSDQQSVSAADEILKYKNLLDIGAITQEEFDEKKSELLNK